VPSQERKRPSPAVPANAPQGGRPLQVVWRERACARAPLDVFRVLVERGERAAFLYSGDEWAPGSRYSTLALAPEPALCVPASSAADPFEQLREALSRWTWGGGDRPHIPFIGGWIGYFSYDLAHRVEHLRTAARLDHTFALIELAFCRRVLAYDHRRGVWTACHLLEEGAPADAVEAELDALLDLVEHARAATRGAAPALDGTLSSNFRREDYEAAVRAVLEYIAAGDVYQVNLSQRFEGTLAVAPEALALRLFEASPAPFSAFLTFGDRAVVSTSPERFLHVLSRAVETWPIKGTRPRGSTPRQDARLRDELLASDKDRAELVMITDLLRNDLGRVCEYGSVQVPKLRAVASYRNVHHTYSRVTGRLRPEADLADLLRATLPGGSVTGAPKIRAMEIIEELEPTARGPYCGAVGAIGVDGKTDLSIAIRTVLCEGKRLTFQVGGGIVADSRPADEYAETLHKARGIMGALGAAAREAPL
jgi:para-aminobenzoate synthetase component 1